MRSMQSPEPAQWCLKGARSKAVEPDEDVDAADEQSRERPPVRCRGCETPLARHEWAFDPNGRGVRQVHANPAGIIFEVRTFERATNLVDVGRPSDTFTWFPGFAWTIVLCVGCHGHVGWRFTREDASFVGLVNERVSP